MLHQIRVVLVGILAGLPQFLLILWAILLSLVFRMRPRAEAYPAGEMRASSGFRIVVNKCGCRHLEVMWTRGETLHVVKFHYGRCVHGAAEDGKGGVS